MMLRDILKHYEHCQPGGSMRQIPWSEARAAELEVLLRANGWLPTV